MIQIHVAIPFELSPTPEPKVMNFTPQKILTFSQYDPYSPRPTPQIQGYGFHRFIEAFVFITEYSLSKIFKECCIFRWTSMK